MKREMFQTQYANVFDGDDQWRALPVPAGDRYAWSDASTYVKNPPYFDGMTATPPGVRPITNARVLGMYGDSITTDHISPAGSIAEKSPAGQWLIAQGVAKKDFNSYGARRGNHEVMMRGTFANIRLRNELVPRQGRLVDRDDSRCGAGCPLRRGDGHAVEGHAAARDRREGVRHRVRRATGRPRARRC